MMPTTIYRARHASVMALCHCALLCAFPLAASAAPARPGDALVDLINAYRAAPGNCAGQAAAPVAPLARQPALGKLHVATGMLLDQVLEHAGYPVAHADAIAIDGATDARAAMQILVSKYCATLLSQRVAAIGVTQTGNDWLIVLAQPAPPSPLRQLPTSHDAGLRILELVNQARATPRSCGERAFTAAPPLAWNDALTSAAQAHSTDMATLRYFSHEDRDGHMVDDRALQAGYRWRVIGENIAAGQESVDDVVTGWLGSPGHCANIMDSRFTEMGAAYGVNSARETARVYWTQVFGTPR